MIFDSEWLTEYLDGAPDLDTLAGRLTSCGCLVELREPGDGAEKWEVTNGDKPLDTNPALSMAASFSSPAVVYTASQPWTKEEVHVTLQFYFILAGALIASGHALSGLTTGQTVRSYVLLLPALVTGCAAGYALHRRVSQDLYRRLVYVLLLALGIMLLWR